MDVKAPLHFQGHVAAIDVWLNLNQARLFSVPQMRRALGKLCHLSDAAIDGFGVQNGRRPVSLISLRTLLKAEAGHWDSRPSDQAISRQDFSGETSDLQALTRPCLSTS
jgi:hypothetical protein